VCLVSIALALVSAACGPSPRAGSSVTPSPTSNASAVLTTGSYVLSLSTGPGTGSTWVCLMIGSDAPSSARITMAVEATDRGWSAAAASGTLSMALQPGPGSVSGTLRGSAPSDDRLVSVVVNGSGGPDASATGYQSQPDAVAGQIEGSVLFSAGGGTMTCSSTWWSLTRQQ
jgi:hypothetical protein